MSEDQLALQAEAPSRTLSFGNKMRFYGALVVVTAVGALAAVGCGGSSDRDPGSSPATGGGDPVELPGGAQAGNSTGNESAGDEASIDEPAESDEGCTGPYAGNPDLDDNADGVCRVGVAGSDCWGYAVKPDGFRDDLYILDGGTMNEVPLSRVIDCIEGYTGIELGSPEDYINYSVQDQDVTVSGETDGSIDTSIGSGKTTYYVNPDSPIPWGEDGGGADDPAVKGIDPDTKVEDADVPPYSMIMIDHDSDREDVIASGVSDASSYPILGETTDLEGLETICQDDAAQSDGGGKVGYIQFFDSTGLYGSYMCFVLDEQG